MPRRKIRLYLIGVQNTQRWSLMTVCHDLEKRGMTIIEFDRIASLRVGQTFSTPQLPDVKRVQ